MQRTNSKSPPQRLPTISRIPFHGNIKYLKRQQKKQLKLPYRPQQNTSQTEQKIHKSIAVKDPQRYREKEPYYHNYDRINNSSNDKKLDLQSHYKIVKQYSNSKPSVASLDYQMDHKSYRKINDNNSYNASNSRQNLNNKSNRSNSKSKIKSNSKSNLRYLQQKKQSNTSHDNSLFSKNSSINQILEKVLALQRVNINEKHRNYSLKHQIIRQTDDHNGVQFTKQTQNHKRKVSSHRGRVKTDGRNYYEHSRISSKRIINKNQMYTSQSMDNPQQAKIIREIQRLDKQYIRIKSSQSYTKDASTELSGQKKQTHKQKQKQKQKNSYGNKNNRYNNMNDNNNNKLGYKIKKQTVMVTSIGVKENCGKEGEVQNKDKTLEDFQKCVNINRQLIHKQINRNMVLKKNHRNSKNNIAGKNQRLKEVLGNNQPRKLAKNSVTNDKHLIHNRQSSGIKNPFTKQKYTDSIASHNKFEATLIEALDDKNDRRRKSKSQLKRSSRNVYSQQSTKIDLNQEQQIFNDIYKVLQNKIFIKGLQSQKRTDKNSKMHLYPAQFHLHRLKQSQKIQKLAEKIRQMSPQKSLDQIRQQMSTELANQFGLAQYTDHTDNIKQLKNKAKTLKNQKNYYEWRRVQLKSGGTLSNNVHSNQIISFDSINRSITDSSYDASIFSNLPNTSSLKTHQQIEYKQSNYELQNQRLTNFIMKNQISLQNYLRNRKQLLNLNANNSNNISNNNNFEVSRDSEQLLT